MVWLKSPSHHCPPPQPFTIGRALNMRERERLVDQAGSLDTWNDLANAIETASSVAFLLTAAADKPPGKERNNAVTFAAYQLEELVTETRELFRKLCAEIRASRAARDEAAPGLH